MIYMSSYVMPTSSSMIPMISYVMHIMFLRGSYEFLREHDDPISDSEELAHVVPMISYVVIHTIS